MDDEKQGASNRCDEGEASGQAKGSREGSGPCSHDYEKANCTDLGNARRLIKHFGKDLRYCHAQKRWYIWNGVYWRPDLKNEIELRAKSLPDLIVQEALVVIDGETRKKQLQWSIASESAYHIKNAIDLSRSEPDISIH